MSIQDITDKFKGLVADDTFFYGLLLILLAVTSFGLGRLSVLPGGPERQPASVVLSDTGSVPVSSGEYVDTKTAPEQYVGSRNSDKYHHVTCPGASRIKEENKVWFSSKEAAEAAGYSPAANCAE